MIIGGSIINSNSSSSDTDRGGGRKRRIIQCISGDIHQWQSHKMMNAIDLKQVNDNKIKTT